MKIEKYTKDFYSPQRAGIHMLGAPQNSNILTLGWVWGPQEGTYSSACNLPPPLWAQVAVRI